MIRRVLDEMAVNWTEIMRFNLLITRREEWTPQKPHSSRKKRIQMIFINKRISAICACFKLVGSLKAFAMLWVTRRAVSFRALSENDRTGRDRVY